MKNWHNEDHPAYKLLHYMVTMTALTFILYVNASDFDMTEGNTLILIALFLGGWEAVQLVIKRFWKGE